uniref:NADH dehydrogenase subunit 5 n=1 Tax=Comanthus parvicirrus TaxID=1529418 RepID=UPI001EDD8AF3|nr:NADH dehydrogenase subunit 5 [Comanthus parvicirrus]UFQ22714.1 NADH dehydrogenase subunit 5 [Comanthus parvicirrus]UHY39309.1 NADH dehydrogenase subunit 5 [Comanthus parvicirrus]
MFCFLLVGSISLFIFIVLIMSIFSSSYLLSSKFSVGYVFGLFFNNNNVFFNFSGLSIGSLKVLSFFSFFSFYFYLSFGCPNINIIIFEWLENYGFLSNFSFVLDFYTFVFFLVGSYVTWSIIEFSYYYMNDDPRWFSFFRLLLIFLFNMLMLVSSNNLFFVFVGWEGVGFLSFLLISWWNTRNDANSSALEAVIYNRLGDVGFLILLSLCFVYFNTWSLLEISVFLNNCDLNIVYCFLFSVLIASMAKSAQIGFHPWLPAAMEGPTPVSALLHSSTMVVAGVFFLIRVGDLVNFPSFFCSFCLFVGGVTSLFAASAALVQHDIKKVIAYSTTSQLGLMVVSIGLGNCVVSFFHVCTHAFFKAMLFLCSGSIIHSLNNEQDLRKMGGLFNFLPVTSSCLFLGSLALVGTPFLSGFYSKDLILELGFLSFTSFLGIFLAFLSSLFTIIYSFRIIFFCFLYPMLSNSLCSSITEENFNLIFSIFRLGLGTVFCGWFFCGYVFPSVVFVLPFFLKSLSFLLIFIGILLSFCFYLSYKSFLFYSFVYWFLSFQWFFLIFSHFYSFFFYFIFSLYGGSRLLDRGWYEVLGPQGSGLLIFSSSSSGQYFYGGYIKYYIFSSILTSIFVVTLLVFI